MNNLPAPYFTLAQVLGRKWVWVAPPSLKHEMYPFGSSSSASSEGEGEDGEEEAAGASSYMGNTTQVDVTIPPSDLREPFPDFVKKVVPVARQAELQEGDLLFMPPGSVHPPRLLLSLFLAKARVVVGQMVARHEESPRVLLSQLLVLTQ
jgi:hypothetical protein